MEAEEEEEGESEKEEGGSEKEEGAPSLPLPSSSSSSPPVSPLTGSCELELKKSESPPVPVLVLALLLKGRLSRRSPIALPSLSGCIVQLHAAYVHTLSTVYLRAFTHTNTPP